MTAASAPARPALVGRRPVLVTGGAGFIGSNLADRLAREGHDVLVYDALARPGVESNLAWLKGRHPQRISSVIGDIRDERGVAAAARDAEAVFHFAAQVAVTTSLVDAARGFRHQRAGHAQPARGAAPAQRPGPARSSPRPTRSTAISPTSRSTRPTTPICRAIRRCARRASARIARSISTRPMAARRAPPTSTSSTMPAASACRPRSCA